MKQLRQIVYLDEYKMYSLYSQLFEGFTDYVVQYQETSKKQEEQQKGPFGSGRFLADLAVDRAGQHERRFLHDYAYTQFEERLISEKMVVEYERLLPGQSITATPGMLLKVKGRAVFNDIKAICDLVSKFNQLGQAIGYVTTQNERTATRELVEQKLKEEKDRNARAKLKDSLKNVTDITRQSLSAGLHQDETFLKHLEYLLEYGYGGQFEVQIHPTGDSYPQPFFSALLKRDCLREDATLLVKNFRDKLRACSVWLA